MAEPIKLADTGLELVAEADDVHGPDQLVPGFGNTMRDGIGVRAGRGGVDVAVVGGLIVDPLLGVRYASLGIDDGRIVSIGRAGNPDTTDGVDVVLGPQTAVFDATGLIVTPGAVDTHVHWLSPQVADNLLAGGVTTMVSQDYGPVWNLGTGPAAGLDLAWAALDSVPLNAALLVRGSSVDPEPVADSLRAGGAGLKIHEDVGAGPGQIDSALKLCDAFDVQLAIHTDGLNEVLDVAGTLAAFAGRTVHCFHIEGAGGGHAPDLLSLAGRERILTSSTTPTIPFGIDTVAEHEAMVAAVHVLEPGRVLGDKQAAHARVRPATMAAEGVLHDLGLIHMVSSDSQGMGRAGEVLRRAIQNAAVMKQARGRGDDTGLADNERVLRHVAKATINPAVAHGLSHDVGALTVGRVADCVLWRPENFAVRPELTLKMGMPVWGAAGDGNAVTMLCEPVVVGQQVGALGAAPAQVSIAFVAEAALEADLATDRPRSAVSGCRDVTAADMVRNTSLADVAVSADGTEVTVDGERVGIEPVESVPLGRRHLLG
ncbi:MAG TPA: urease subunit alpha [Baekduia sp.]|nr:urease subunit alpha [Baekduia sp.]